MKELMKLCKCGVYLTVNQHRDYYQTVDQYFEDISLSDDKVLEDIDTGVYDKMKELNIVIELQFYPDAPIGFYKVYHYDLDLAISEAIETFNKK